MSKMACFDSKVGHSPLVMGDNHMFLPHAHWWGKKSKCSCQKMLFFYLNSIMTISFASVLIQTQGMAKSLQSDVSTHPTTLKNKALIIFSPAVRVFLVVYRLISSTRKLTYGCSVLLRRRGALGFPPLRSNFAPPPPSLKFSKNNKILCTVPSKLYVFV